MAGTMVEFKANGGTAQGYLAKPPSGSGPGVVVVQEWAGLVPHIKDVADRFAAEGFVALAPDLYHGRTAEEPDEAEKLMMAMQMGETAKDLRGAVEYVLSEGGATGEKVAVVGYCMGGQLALYAATVSDKVGAVADYYGIHPSAEPDLDELSAPVLGIFAEKDEWAPPEAARALEAQIKEKGVETDFVIYPGTDHGFFNDTRPEVHDTNAAADAWRRTLAWFRKHLK